MNLEDLKKYECPFLEVNLREVVSEDYKWYRVDQDSLFRVEHSKDVLKEHQVIVPVFTDDMMLPFEYVHEINKRKSISYASYAPVVRADIVYRKGHLLKFIHKFGVEVLKRSEEKYTEFIVEKEKHYHFKFDFEISMWKYVSDIENVWIPERQKIDAVRRSFEFSEAGRKYYQSYQSTVKTPEKYASLQEELYAYLTLLETSNIFFNYKMILGEITQDHFGKLKNRANMIVQKIQKALMFLEKVQINTKPNPQAVIPNSHEYTAIEQIADIETLITNNFARQGYWVIEEQTYANAAELYALEQQATNNRNEKTKLMLKKCLLKEFKYKNKTFVYLSDLH